MSCFVSLAVALVLVACSGTPSVESDPTERIPAQLPPVDGGESDVQAPVLATGGNAAPASPVGMGGADVDAFAPAPSDGKGGAPSNAGNTASMADASPTAVLDAGSSAPAEAGAPTVDAARAVPTVDATWFGSTPDVVRVQKCVGTAVCTQTEDRGSCGPAKDCSKSRIYQGTMQRECSIARCMVAGDICMSDLSCEQARNAQECNAANPEVLGSDEPIMQCAWTPKSVCLAEPMPCASVPVAECANHAGCSLE